LKRRVSQVEKNFVGTLTAQGATETVRTSIGTYTVPLGVSKLVEVGVQISTAGFTTLEDIGGILEIECNNAPSWTTQQFVTDTVVPLTSGAQVIPSRVHDVNVPVTPNSVLEFFMTYNRALTINPSSRAFGKFQ
jgi:hypothetical protein